MVLVISVMPYIFIVSPLVDFRVHNPDVDYSSLRLKHSLVHIHLISAAFLLLVIIFRFAFSKNAPMKIGFMQRLDLDYNNQTSYLVGAVGYEELFSVMPHLKHSSCKPMYHRKLELTGCEYPGLVPDFNGSLPMKVTIDKERKELTVESEHSKACLLHLEKVTDLNVTTFTKDGSHSPAVSLENIRYFHLIRRSFGGGFRVKFNTKQKVLGAVYCGYDDLEIVKEAKALVAEMPSWAAFVDFQMLSGLLQVEKYFEI